MNSKRLACVLALAGFAMVGCDGTPSFTFPPRDSTCADPNMVPCATSENTTEEARTVPTPRTFPDGVTNTYVLAQISLPRPAEGTTRQLAPGFNVDGLDSGEGSEDLNANCEQFQPDYQSTTDPQHVGVDNALSGLIPTIEGLVGADGCPGGQTMGCIDALLAEQLEGGSFLLLMEVSDINDYSFDESITLQLFLGEVPANGELMLDGSGRIAPGQTFDTQMVQLGPAVAGDIYEGRLAARADVLPLNIDLGDGMSLTLTITQAQVRFNISETELTRGAIGGVITVQSIIDAAVMIMPGIEGTVRSVVEGVADVTPSSDPMVCEAVSVGIEFSAVAATRNP